MVKKIGNFFEEHIEKIVLLMVGVLCFWLFITRVLLSPNFVLVDNKKFSSSNIDDYINDKAQILKDKLESDSGYKRTYDPQFNHFDALVDSAISDIDISFHIPQPKIFDKVRVQPKYVIPLVGQDRDVVGEIGSVVAEHIRAAAYVPTEEIDEKNLYDEVGHELGDIDFVTVEATFDVADLYERFYDSFAGEDVKLEWRDPCLARPIFAAVQLQRQQLGKNGIWGDWEIVPRARIEAHRQMFEIVEDVENSGAAELKVRMLQFDNAAVRIDLLQPGVYRIASPKEEWFPPSLHKEYAARQKEIEKWGRLKALETERRELELKREKDIAEKERLSEERQKKRSERTSTKSGTRTRTSRKSDTKKERSDHMAKRLERKRERESGVDKKSEDPSETMSLGDFYDKLNTILITKKSDLAGMTEPLVFWAHDDTAEPENSYRYKIRLGVFNPMWGTDGFNEEDAWLKDDVVLWSAFSDITEPLSIPRRLYFFPREVQTAASPVTMHISKYELGYWYGWEFQINRGEAIGKAVEFGMTDVEEGVTVPEEIDYATGAVLVDVISVKDWVARGSLRERYYFDMLYSFDGKVIEHIPVKQVYWSRDLQAKYDEIRRYEKEPRLPLRSWSGARPGASIERMTERRPRRGSARRSVTATRSTGAGRYD